MSLEADQDEGVLHAYALDEGNLLRHISGITESDRGRGFKCPGCGEDFIFRIGKIRAHHFAHRNSVGNCSFESYLHSAAKLTLAATYRECLQTKTPFILEFPRSIVCDCPNANGDRCHLGEETVEYDLTQTYTDVDIECSLGSLRPDVLLKGKSRQLLVEINVTHFVDDVKAASKEQIIEIDVSSEDDIDSLRKPRLSRYQSNVRVFNIKIEPYKRRIRAHECRKQVFAFIVYTNGKCAMANVSYGRLSIPRMVQDFKTLDPHKLIPGRSGREFIELVLEARNKGLKVLNCHLCRYHALEVRFGVRIPKAFCKLRREQVNSNFATECEAYRDDPKAYSRM